MPSEGLVRSPSEAMADAFTHNSSPESETAAFKSAVAERGRSSEAWTAQAQDSFGHIFDLVPRELASTIEVSAVECFYNGCAATVTYREPQRFMTLNQAILDSPGLLSWPGAKAAGPPVHTSNGTTQYWVLIRPISSGN